MANEVQFRRHDKEKIVPAFTVSPSLRTYAAEHDPTGAGALAEQGIPGRRRPRNDEDDKRRAKNKLARKARRKNR